MTRSRFLNGAEASRCYGVLAGTYAASLMWADPLADAAAEALHPLRGRWWPMVLKALEEGIDKVPDAPAALGTLIASLPAEPSAEQWAAMDRGRAAVARTGDGAGLVLQSASLMMDYWSPPVTKTLLQGDKPSEHAKYRLAQAGAWWIALHEPDGVRRGGSGYKATVHVRLIRAFVRRMARGSGAWDREAWGEPLNQGDLFFRIVCFTRLMLDGLRRIGYDLSAEETDGYYAFWRHAAAVLGVHKTYLPMIDAVECERFWYLWRLTNPGPDQQTVALAKTMLDALAAGGSGGSAFRRRRRHAVLCGMAYRLLDWDIAQGLDIPYTTVGHWSARLHRPMAVLSGVLGRGVGRGGNGELVRTIRGIAAATGTTSVGTGVVSSPEWLEALAEFEPKAGA